MHVIWYCWTACLCVPPLRPWWIRALTAGMVAILAWILPSFFFLSHGLCFECTMQPNRLRYLPRAVGHVFLRGMFCVSMTWGFSFYSLTQRSVWSVPDPTPGGHGVSGASRFSGGAGIWSFTGPQHRLSLCIPMVWEIETTSSRQHSRQSGAPVTDLSMQTCVCGGQRAAKVQ